METVTKLLEQPLLLSESLAHPAATVSLLLFVALFLYWYGTRGFADLKKLNVPGPKPIPFLGNFLEARKYSGIYQMHLAFLKNTAECSPSVWAAGHRLSLPIRSF